MPETQVVFYQETDGEVPVLEWLMQLVKQNHKGYANCVARIGQVAEAWIRAASSGGRLPD